MQHSLWNKATGRSWKGLDEAVNDPSSRGLTTWVSLEWDPEIRVAPVEENSVLETSLNEVSFLLLRSILGFPDGSVVKNPLINAGGTEDTGSIPGPGGSPRGGKGNTLQYSCLENSMDREVWQATVHGVAKSQTQLSTHHEVAFWPW